MNARIRIDPNVCHGRPTIQGTRVMVSTILGALSAGDSIDTILKDYPNISTDDVGAALEFAAELTNYQTALYEAVA